MSTDVLIGLSMGQVDALWNCLAMDPQCSDDCLNWFYSQTKNKEYHAFGIETLKHIFIEKVVYLKWYLLQSWEIVILSETWKFLYFSTWHDQLYNNI